MSETKPSRRVAGHEVVVKGEYLVFTERVPGKLRQGKEHRGYEEKFVVPFNHGAPLTYVLAHMLGPRLREKDPRFRAVKTHHLVGDPIVIFESTK